MEKFIKNEKGYIYLEDVMGWLCTIGLVVFVLLIICMFVFGLHLDFASGSHRIKPTAVDTDMFGNYKVYFKTTEYEKNSQEDYYYIDKNNINLVNEVREIIKEGKEIIVYYDKYVGFYGFGSPDTAPITKVEIIEERN